QRGDGAAEDAHGKSQVGCHAHREWVEYRSRVQAAVACQQVTEYRAQFMVGFVSHCTTPSMRNRTWTSGTDRRPPRGQHNKVQVGSKCKKALDICISKAFSMLVAGAGFEPTTFGL